MGIVARIKQGWREIAARHRRHEQVLREVEREMQGLIREHPEIANLDTMRRFRSKMREAIAYERERGDQLEVLGKED